MTREQAQNWLPLIKAFIEHRLQGKRKGRDNWFDWEADYICEVDVRRYDFRVKEDGES